MSRLVSYECKIDMGSQVRTGFVSVNKLTGHKKKDLIGAPIFVVWEDGDVWFQSKRKCNYLKGTTFNDLVELLTPKEKETVFYITNLFNRELAEFLL